MKKFRIEQPFLNIFPDVRIGIIVCRGIDNRIKEENKYARYLSDAQRQAQQYVTAPEFIETELGGKCEMKILGKDNPEAVIED